MPKFKDLTGQKFGRLLILSLTGEINNDKRHLYNARCDCGKECIVVGRNVVRGTSSCGCLKTELMIKRNTTHGLRFTREYLIWLGIKKRCFDKNHSSYSNYGAKGITMFSEWKEDFEKFLAYVGNCPEKDSTIDRIDNRLGYFPDNVRWLPPADQSRNKKKLKSNKSGVTGVTSRLDRYGNKNWMALWRREGKRLSKNFAVNRHGEELAFFMACEYREQMINLLKLEGVFYSDDHGK